MPSGIATDYSTKLFIQKLVNNYALASFYDFTNRGYIFKSLESTYSFSLLTVSNLKVEKVCLGAQLWKVDDLGKVDRVYNLSIEDIKRLNPNTKNLPILRSTQDAKLIKRIYSNVPVLENENNQDNPWQVNFSAMFNMSNDAESFFLYKKSTRRRMDFG